MDQITEGQLEWAKLDENYDVVSIGYGDDNRRYPVCEDHKQWANMLKKQFPDEEAAIDEFFRLNKIAKPAVKMMIIVKLLPLWVSKLLINTGIIHYITKLWNH